MSRVATSEGGVRYRWFILVVAVLVHATSIALVWQAVSPLKQAMAHSLGVEWQQVVVVYATLSFGLVFTQIPGGAIGDKYPIRYVVGSGAVLTGLATAVRFAVPSLAGQVVVSIVATVGMGLVNPNLIKVVTEWFPTPQLGLGQGVLMAGYNVGMGLALALSAGVVLAAVDSWGAVFVLYGGFTVAAGILWFVFVRSPRADERPTAVETGAPFSSTDRVPLRDSLPAVLRAPSTPWAVVVAALAYWSVIGSLAVLPEFADAHTYVVPEIALGAPPIAATVGALALPLASDRYSRRLGLQSGIFGLVAGIILTGIAPSLVVFLLGMVVAGVFGGGLAAMFYILPGELADVDPNHVGTMAGVMLSLAQLGAVAGSITVAQVFATSGLLAAATAAAGPCLIGLLFVSRLHLDGRGNTERRTDAVGTDD